jgi:NSS family neurotransmitter:Na+ symporter
MTFYSVVGGWTLGYIVKSASGAISSIRDMSTAEAVFESFVSSPAEAIGYHFLFISATMFIVIRGIKNGIEKWNKVPPSALFVNSVHIGKGLQHGRSSRRPFFISTPISQKSNLKTVIEAMGQCLFQPEPGNGRHDHLRSYLSRNEKVLGSSLQIVAFDTLAALLSGLR